MKFYNREQETTELQRIASLSFTKNSRMTVLTGRRRIGKTSLIKHAFRNSEAPMLYFFVARKTEAALVDSRRAVGRRGFFGDDGTNGYLERNPSTPPTV